MKKSKLFRYFVIYYGILQFIHLLANFIVIFIDAEYMIGNLSENLLGNRLEVILISSYVDFFVASPAGIIFAIGYLAKKKWADIFGQISLNFAAASAFIYIYFLTIYSAWEVNFLGGLIAVAFSPLLILYILYIKNQLQGKSLNEI